MEMRLNSNEIKIVKCHLQEIIYALQEDKGVVNFSVNATAKLILAELWEFRQDEMKKKLREVTAKNAKKKKVLAKLGDDT